MNIVKLNCNTSLIKINNPNYIYIMSEKRQEKEDYQKDSDRTDWGIDPSRVENRDIRFVTPTPPQREDSENDED